MILYYSPGACSLACHIALHEADLRFDHDKVDLKAKTTQNGRNFREINPKGYVPALALDGGEILTENIAILSWIADQAPALKPEGALAPYRLLETLAFISTEVHKSFSPLFAPNTPEQTKRAALEKIAGRLDFIAARLKGDYLFGARFTVADAYLFVMLLWSRSNGLPLTEPLPAYVSRLEARPAVAMALKHEGLA